MLDFLVFYYAMGWATHGIGFALLRDAPSGPCPFPLFSIAFWPVALPMYVTYAVTEKAKRMPKGRQYLWRKP